MVSPPGSQSLHFWCCQRSLVNHNWHAHTTVCLTFKLLFLSHEFKCVISMKIIYITKSRHIILNFHCYLTHAIDCLVWLRIKERTRFIISCLMEWIHCTSTYISTSEPKRRPTWLPKGNFGSRSQAETTYLFNRPVGLQSWSHPSVCIIGELEGA